jgi:ankyrin repeat protein
VHGWSLQALPASPGEQLRAVMRNCVVEEEGQEPDHVLRSAEQAEGLGWTALMSAALWGHAGLVGRLLAHDPEQQVLAVDKHGQTALMYATASGHAACLGPLLSHSPKLQVRAKDLNRMTALMYAAASRNAACLDPLLAHDPKQQLRATDNNGWAALELACECDQMQCAKVMLAHKAPLPTNASTLAKLSPIVHDMAHSVLDPSVLHQSMAKAIQALHAPRLLLP